MSISNQTIYKNCLEKHLNDPDPFAVQRCCMQQMCQPGGCEDTCEPPRKGYYAYSRDCPIIPAASRRCCDYPLYRQESGAGGKFFEVPAPNLMKAIGNSCPCNEGKAAKAFWTEEIAQWPDPSMVEYCYQHANGDEAIMDACMKRSSTALCKEPRTSMSLLEWPQYAMSYGNFRQEGSGKCSNCTMFMIGSIGLFLLVVLFIFFSCKKKING